jgi:hypothetical protein
MKKKALMVVLCVVMLATLLVASAQAGQIYNCIVNSCGVSGTVYYLNISDTAAAPAFTNFTFFMPTNAGGDQKAMLAGALTAWSTGGKCAVWLDNTAQYSTVSLVAATN